MMLFLVTSITMLLERTSGTLERLMSLPIAKADLLFGYAIAFAPVSAVRAALTGAVRFALLGVSTAGPAWTIVALAIANAPLGMALGPFHERVRPQRVPGDPVHARPALPPDPVERPARAAQAHARRPARVSDVLPVSYAYDGLARVSADQIGRALWVDLAVVAGCILGFLALASNHAAPAHRLKPTCGITSDVLYQLSYVGAKPRIPSGRSAPGTGRRAPGPAVSGVAAEPVCAAADVPLPASRQCRIRAGDVCVRRAVEPRLRDLDKAEVDRHHSDQDQEELRRERGESEGGG